MQGVLRRCSVCGGLLDEEDLFCANCGTESPESDAQPLETLERATHNFSCAGCGASMNYDAKQQALRCPFCGSVDLEQQSNRRMIRPDRGVPFAVDRADLEPAFRQWCGQGFWRPGDLGAEAQLAEITPIYVPFWRFQADTHTYWTADSSQTPLGARGDWFPHFGENHNHHDGILVPAGGALTATEVEAILPFDFQHAIEGSELDLTDVAVEQFAFGRKYARPLAREAFEAREAAVCTSYVPGRCRHMKVNVLLENLSGRPVLLPFWVVAYRYREQIYRFVANGQTGKSTGTAPVSWRKVSTAVVLFAIVVLVILLLLLIS